MVVYSYQVRQQKRGLSPLQLRLLNQTLSEKSKSPSVQAECSGIRFIEKIDDELQVLWRRGEDGNPVVLSIVTQNDSVEHIAS